ncbi:hypothetical protein ABTE06_21890, partial [Acinetobacter baumannii]
FLVYVIRSERRIRREEIEDALERGEEPPAPAPRTKLDPVAAHRDRKRPRDNDAADEDALLDAR